MSETPGTSTDPALGTEGDDDQLTREDALLDSPVDDVLDEGYSPPDRERSNRWGETPYEETVGQPLDRRLTEEEPEVWERTAPPRGREADRSGRLEDTNDGWRSQDAFARDAGIAGGAASAEEAAMHTVPDEAIGRDEIDEDEDEGAGGDESREG